jgi:hypothetical protein
VNTQKLEIYPSLSFEEASVLIASVQDHSLTEIYDILHSQDLIQQHLKTSAMPLAFCQEVVVLFPKKEERC